MSLSKKKPQYTDVSEGNTRSLKNEMVDNPIDVNNGEDFSKTSEVALNSEFRSPLVIKIGVY